MPRFEPDKWKAADDSSVGYKTLDDECIILHVALRMEGPGSAMGCPCGCSGFPSGDKTTFCMGHDARLRGILIRAHLTDTPIRYVLGDTVMDPVSADGIAAGYFWTSYLEAAALRREGKNLEVLNRALLAPKDRLIKVARWSVTGQVIAIYHAKRPGMHLIEWVDKAGNTKLVTVREDESPLTDIAQQQVSGA